MKHVRGRYTLSNLSDFWQQINVHGWLEVLLKIFMGTTGLLFLFECLHETELWPFPSPSLGIQGRVLINIWIPSAFLHGTSSDQYHVYQVYVRIRDEEWNIFRRYSQFLDLHTRLKKVYPIINKFDFPPKKSVGNKVNLLNIYRYIFIVIVINTSAKFSVSKKQNGILNCNYTVQF